MQVSPWESQPTTSAALGWTLFLHTQLGSVVRVHTQAELYHGSKVHNRLCTEPTAKINEQQLQQYLLHSICYQPQVD